VKGLGSGSERRRRNVPQTRPDRTRRVWQCHSWATRHSPRCDLAILVLGRRLWVEAQIAYLNGLRKFTEHELQAFIAGKDGPNQDNAPRSKISGSTYRLAGPVDQSSAYWSMSGPFVGLAAITLPVAHRAPQLGMIGAGTTSRS
jgi:hypothetical protein